LTAEIAKVDASKKNKTKRKNKKDKKERVQFRMLLKRRKQFPAKKKAAPVLRNTNSFTTSFCFHRGLHKTAAVLSVSTS
jgi:hypothetical protein